jgi:hypothetical protein
MTDPTALYSYQGKHPEVLPYKIRLNDGTAPSDPSTYTKKQLAEAGYTGPYEFPEFIDDGNQRVIWDEEKLEFSIETFPIPGSEMTAEEVWDGIRNVRNILLAESDWTVLDDTPLTSTQNQQALDYRQSLRDYPSTITDILALKEEILASEDPNPVFKIMPTAPSFIVSPRD